MTSTSPVPQKHHESARTLVRAAVVLGVGLGGLFDGIVLHQVLQWHHIASTPHPPTSLEALELNTLLDGLFHATAWMVTFTGALLLLAAGEGRATPGAGRLFWGGLLAGWGVFNFVEGIVDHHLLNLHHVRPGPDELLYDIGFLVWGATMVVAGVILVRGHGSGRRAPR